MNTAMTSWRLMRWLFFVPPIQNPDEARRRAILARVLVFLILLAVFMSAQMTTLFPADQVVSGQFLQNDEVRTLFVAAQLGSLFFAVVWWLNRWNLKSIGWLPSVITELLFIVIISQSDTPVELIDGRSLMLWVLPIALSPLILPSWTAFLSAAACSIAISVIAVMIHHGINIYAISGLLALAFVSWLSARALEQALRAARNEAEKNRVILENVADGVLVVDDAGNVQIANPAAHALLGDALEEAACQSESRVEYPGRIVEFSWATIQGVGRAAVVRDITRQVEVERAKDALLRTVSHELRTPLAAISGFADVIKMLSQNDKISEMAVRISANVGRLKEMVNSLLDQAQIQAGTLQLVSAPFSPRKLAQDVYSLMSGLAAEKDLAFDINFDPEVPETVIGDYERLRQVLVNLVGNAIKFTDHGSIDLKLMKICYERWGFSVRDTGDGIPTVRIPDIFKPFRRGSDYATRTRQGAGLGLSISKQLVEMMGGDISVQSEVGKGTTFIVSIPFLYPLGDRE